PRAVSRVSTTRSCSNLVPQGPEVERWSGPYGKGLLSASLDLPSSEINDPADAKPPVIAAVRGRVRAPVARRRAAVPRPARGEAAVQDLAPDRVQLLPAMLAVDDPGAD